MKKFIKKYGSAGELVIHVVLLALLSFCIYVLLHTDNALVVGFCIMIIVAGVFVSGFMDYCRDAVIKEEYKDDY